MDSFLLLRTLLLKRVLLQQLNPGEVREVYDHLILSPITLDGLHLSPQSASD